MHLPDSSVLVSGESTTPLSPSPLSAVGPVPAFSDGWTLTPPSGSKRSHDWDNGGSASHGQQK